MYIIGSDVLFSWNGKIAKQAIDMFHSAASELLQMHNGYQVETANNLLLAAFHSPAAAIVWSLECIEQMHTLDW
jgi:hypothetical protein